MKELSAVQLEIARKNEQRILQALASEGQKHVAEATELSESDISRLKSTDNKINFHTLSMALAFLGLKVVPVTHLTYRPEDIQLFIDLAKRQVASIESAADLADSD